MVQRVPDWKSIQLVIFDVDGTLYHQSKLRRKVAFDLLSYYSLRPWKAVDLQILSHYRSIREEHAGEEFLNLQTEQYQWTANHLNISTDKVEALINKWMYLHPLKYLKSCRYNGLKDFFRVLESQKIQRAVFSDYQFESKMNYLELSYELGVASTDASVNALKPNAKGLAVLLDKANISADECLYIGDRIERDGECAKRLNIQYLNVDPNDHKYFIRLTNQLNGA
jgi:HAD superfamily hydrolase (TIGR01549 family)